MILIQPRVVKEDDDVLKDFGGKDAPPDDDDTGGDSTSGADAKDQVWWPPFMFWCRPWNVFDYDTIRVIVNWVGDWWCTGDV